MRLELSNIRQPETGFAKVFQPADIPGGGDDYGVKAPVDLRLVIHQDQDRFRLVGTVKTTLELVCSRCLEPFPFPVDMPFDLRYLPQHLNMGAGGGDEADEDADAESDAEEVGGDDLTTAFYRDDQIDLAHMVREQLYLALPMKPLHREDCQGLCPSCGVNLNETTCACQTEWEDPRLAPLKKLKI